MQTLEFTRAMKEIVDELKVGGLLSLLGSWLTPGINTQIPETNKNQFAALLFSSNAGYEQLLKRKTTRSILEKLGASEIYEPSRLMGMLALLQSSTQTQNISNNAPAFGQFYSFTALLRSLLKLESTSRELLENEKIGQLPSSDEILELELIEYSDEIGISPKRLEIFVSSITNLHTHLALVHGIPTDSLTFKYFDSGSGLLVGIMAAKPIIDSLKTLFDEYWAKVRFWRYDTFDKKMDAVSKVLTVAGTIHEAVEKKAITQEEGHILKVQILREVDTLVGVGATIPLGESATIDQKQLLTEMRNTKLLGSGTATETDAALPSVTAKEG